MKILITENYDDEPAQAHIETIERQDTFDKQHLMAWLHQHIYNPYFSTTGMGHTDAIDADKQGFYAISDGVYQQFCDLFDKHEAPYLYGDGRDIFYEFKIIEDSQLTTDQKTVYAAFEKAVESEPNDVNDTIYDIIQLFMQSIENEVIGTSKKAQTAYRKLTLTQRLEVFKKVLAKYM